MKKKRLGEILIDNGALTEDKLNAALEAQKKTGERFGEVLLSEGFITKQQLVAALAEELGIEFIDLSAINLNPGLAKYLPKAVAQQYNMVPVRLDSNMLYVAMEDPLNFRGLEAAKATSRMRVIPMIAYVDAITRALSVMYENEGASQAIKQLEQESGPLKASSVGDQEKAGDDTAPAVRLVNSIIERSISEKASDIHIEPREFQVHVRIRVDGRLEDILSFPTSLHSTIVSYLKVLANMNIAERRIPQDGRAVSHRPDGTDIDMRLNTLPTIYGEKVVIRLLWRDKETLTRQGIGMTDRDLANFDKILKNSSGLILIVGPTGSGKTSTLYTMINELNQPTINMISLEDPVEFQIDGVTQVAINEKVGLTFASALRSCLRQDPDVICVGEIRDGETAKIALQAAMTGHLVLSTVHTEDAVSAIDRLKDLGVEPYLIGGSLRGIVSQRLVRKICPSCRVEDKDPDLNVLDLIGIKSIEGRHFYKGAGCSACFKSGYHGRTGVFEILVVNSAMRSVIASGITGTELRDSLQNLNFTPMIVNGRDLVEKGVTTASEILRCVATI